MQNSNLPMTVSDFLNCVQGVGERYLWVDMLCIVQDDEADREYYIPRLSSIYASSLASTQNHSLACVSVVHVGGHLFHIIPK